MMIYNLDQYLTLNNEGHNDLQFSIMLSFAIIASTLFKYKLKYKVDLDQIVFVVLLTSKKRRLPSKYAAN